MQFFRLQGVLSCTTEANISVATAHVSVEGVKQSVWPSCAMKTRATTPTICAARTVCLEQMILLRKTEVRARVVTVKHELSMKCHI